MFHIIRTKDYGVLKNILRMKQKVLKELRNKLKTTTKKQIPAHILQSVIPD
jgi:hypothetical protein